MAAITGPLHLLVPLQILRSTYNLNSFNREACKSVITGLASIDGSIFSNAALFKAHSSIDNYQLTLDGCKALCSSKVYIHPDLGSIINAWMLPILAVFAQVNLRNRKALIDAPHLIGTRQPGRLIDAVVDVFYVLTIHVRRPSGLVLLFDPTH